MAEDSQTQRDEVEIDDNSLLRNDLETDISVTDRVSSPERVEDDDSIMQRIFPNLARE